MVIRVEKEAFIQIFPKAYAVKHKSHDVRMNSRSGGVFTALSDRILEHGGYVYGCAINEQLEAVHKKAASKEERDSFCGSKYVQSNPLNTLREVRCDLQEGKQVLYSGTSCQIAAVNKYLEKEDTAGLMLVDIVCHGVPSPKVYQNYLEWLEHKKRGKINRIDFRNKRKYGWMEQVETVTIDGTEYDSRIYTNLFTRNNILRPSCYKCPHKELLHPGDITIADFWGIDKAVPGFSDNQGVSLVLVNNQKGLDFFRSVEDQLETVECRPEDCLQPSLLSPVDRPSERAEFWKNYRKKPFSYIVRKYASEPFKTRLRLRLEGKIV